MGLPYHYNSRAKLEWICENKHRWEAVPNGIQQGSWCPYCVGGMKLTLENNMISGISTMQKQRH